MRSSVNNIDLFPPPTPQYRCLNSEIQCSESRLSKSSPPTKEAVSVSLEVWVIMNKDAPRWVSPHVARTSKTPASTVSMVTSSVPPPRSNTSKFFSPSSASNLSKPYAKAMLRKHHMCERLFEKRHQLSRTCSSGFIYDSSHFKTGDSARILGCLSLQKKAASVWDKQQ